MLAIFFSEQRVFIGPEKIKEVRNYPESGDKHEVKNFLGLCTYYYCFVPGFLDIAKPLT